jgi:hypothetical protein
MAHVAPAATQVLLLASQQPPPLQLLPLQQAWPGPPQVEQVLPWHAWPLAVHSEPWQHCAPPPPQFEQAPLVHVPWLAPQAELAATQSEPVQHPPLPQVEFAQHAWPAPPQAVSVPPRHTVPPGPLAPSGMQVLVVVSRHAPPPQGVPVAQAGSSGPPHGAQDPAAQARVALLHALPAQHGWPRPPHAAHWLVARHRSPAAQAVPAVTHWFELVLQHPPVQLAPWQHGWPGPPHARHWLFEHDAPAPQALPGQQGWPGPPQAVQALFEHVLPAVVQVWPAQHGWPGPPHAPQMVPP